MKLKDTKTKRFEIRMTEDEYRLLTLCGEFVGRTPTEFVRLLLRSSFVEMREIIERENGEYEDTERVFDCDL